jgi:uncharacterized protein with HEPN domain
MREEKLYLKDIANCIERIESYTSGGKEEFLRQPIIQDAVVRNFEIIGEATKRLSWELKQAYPNVKWRQVSGFRDILIHDYLRVDLDEVWGIIERDLPILKKVIIEILRNYHN